MKKTVSVREALKRVSDHRVPDEDPLDMPAWALVSAALFTVANSGDTRIRGSMRKATTAQKIILDRTVGSRRPGTNPAAQKDMQINFRDLTLGLEPPKES